MERQFRWRPLFDCCRRWLRRFDRQTDAGGALLTTTTSEPLLRRFGLCVQQMTNARSREKGRTFITQSDNVVWFHVRHISLVFCSALAVNKQHIHRRFVSHLISQPQHICHHYTLYICCIIQYTAIFLIESGKKLLADLETLLCQDMQCVKIIFTFGGAMRSTTGLTVTFVDVFVVLLLLLYRENWSKLKLGQSKKFNQRQMMVILG